MKNEQFLNKVLHGDCLDWMGRIEDKSIDMILCDLPYGTTSCKWDAVIPFEPLWVEYERVIKDNGAIVLTAAQPFTSALVMSSPKMFKYDWVWEKSRNSNPALAKTQPLRHHESVLVFCKGKTPYNPQMEIGESYKTRKRAGGKFAGNSVNKVEQPVVERKGRYPKSVIMFNRESGNQFTGKRSFHPTQKPVALFEYLIRTYTNEGETVLDNCIGSGTTAVAAINTGRNFIGIEREWEYCEIANARIDEAQLKHR